MTAVASESQATAASSAAAPPASSAAAPASSMASTAEPSSAAASSSAGSPASSAASSASQAPAQYDLKAAATVDPALVKRIEATARSRGLSNEAGQQLLDAVVAETQAQDTARVEAWKPGGTEWKKRDEEWSKQALADPDLGNGDKAKLATQIELAQKVRTALGGKDFDEFLKTSGLGSHPAALKFLAKIGKSMSEGSLIPGKPVGGGGGKNAAVALYGPDGTGKPKTE